jgi:hypothetical protein
MPVLRLDGVALARPLQNSKLSSLRPQPCHRRTVGFDRLQQCGTTCAEPFVCEPSHSCAAASKRVDQPATDLIQVTTTIATAAVLRETRTILVVLATFRIRLAPVSSKVLLDRAAMRLACQWTPPWRRPWPANSASRLRKLTRPVRAASHPPPPTLGPPRSFVIGTTVSQIDAPERPADNGATLGSHPQDASMIALISEKRSERAAIIDQFRRFGRRYSTATHVIAGPKTYV